MRKIAQELAAGIAIFLAFVIFIVGYLYLKDVPLQGGRYQIKVLFDDVTGLEKSDFVSVSGLRIGRVERLELNGLRVVATLELEPGIKLPEDSQARIKSIGMVGEKFVDIVPGIADTYLKNGDVINGINTGDISDLGGSAEGLMKQLEDLLNEIRSSFKYTLDQNTQTNLKQTVSHIENVSAELNRNTEHMQNIFANLDTVSRGLNELMAARKEMLSASIENFHQASESLPEIVDKLDNSLTTMQGLLDRIENKEGALGKVIASDEFYYDIRRLTTELDSLVQDFKKRPQKYLNLGFIKIF